jgi:transmembrane sensor
VGANRQVILPDGSRAMLGGATALTVAYTADRRTVALNSGEAFFQVRPDTSRPFIVQTPTGTAAAVGTAFDVRTDGGILRVTVSEGVVEVAASEQSARVQGNMGAATTAKSGTLAAPLRIRVGEQAVLRPNAPIVTSTQDPHVATAWTTGTLKFIGEPFDSVIAAVNRYSATRIELRGGGPGRLRYTGTVVSGRTGEWLAALPNVFPVEVVSQDSDRIIIRSRE